MKLRRSIASCGIRKFVKEREREKRARIENEYPAEPFSVIQNQVIDAPYYDNKLPNTSIRIQEEGRKKKKMNVKK